MLIDKKLKQRLADAQADGGSWADDARDPAKVREARRVWRELREQLGLKGAPPLMTPPSSNPKLGKSVTPTWGLTLAPSTDAGVGNMCPASTPECRATCLSANGKGAYPKVKLARIARTRFLVEHPREFLTVLGAEVLKLPQGGVAVRLNVLSDLAWEVVAPELFELRPDVQFYDYTKRWARDLEPAPNYRLAFSWSLESATPDQAAAALRRGKTLVAVFHEPPEAGATVRVGGRRHVDVQVVDGDRSDERFADRGVLVVLKSKGRARRLPVGGFVHAS